jgi:hypothetical protein
MIKLIGPGIKLVGMIKQARPFSSLLPRFSLSRLLALLPGALLSVFWCKSCSSMSSLSPSISLLSLSLSYLSSMFLRHRILDQSNTFIVEQVWWPRPAWASTCRSS